LYPSTRPTFYYEPSLRVIRNKHDALIILIIYISISLVLGASLLSFYSWILDLEHCTCVLPTELPSSPLKLMAYAEQRLYGRLYPQREYIRLNLRILFFIIFVYVLPMQQNMVKLGNKEEAWKRNDSPCLSRTVICSVFDHDPNTLLHHFSDCVNSYFSTRAELRPHPGIAERESPSFIGLTDITRE
jgi:hypothetical protein